jgi:dihydroorotate dehydrogenase (NAD+) catalytic subunit
MAIDSSIDLRVKIGKLVLKNPVMTASGTFGYGEEFNGLVNFQRLGAIVAKGISLAPRLGNPPPRVVETSCGMLNSIGLENVGVERFINEKMEFLRQTRTAVIANILGDTVDDYRQLAERLNEVEGLAAIEVNISCPNVKKGGVAFGSDPEMARAVTAAVRENCSLPVIVKLSPNVTDITEIAKSAEYAGADAVSLINTLLGMAIDSKRRRPLLANVVGGLSGPAIKPVALRMVWQVSQAIQLPVIGIGGITTTEDALEFMLAGATAIQVGTANFVNPRAAEEIISGLADYLQEQKFVSVQDLIGGLQVA